MKLNWGLMIAIMLAIATLRVVGFIPDTWLMLGFIVFVWLWGYLLQEIPTRAKLINWGFGVALTVALMTTVGYNLYSRYIDPYTAASRAATARAQLNTDLETALRINPHMLISRSAINDNIQWLQDKVGEQNEAVLKSIRRRLNAGKIDHAQAWQETRAVLNEEIKWRAESETAIQKLAAKTAKKETADKNAGSWPWRMVAFGAILLAATIFIPQKIKLPGRGLIGFIGAMVLVAGLALVFFPEAQAKLAEDDKPASAAHLTPPPASVIYSEPTPQLPANAVRVKTLAPGEKIYLTRASMDAPPPERWAKSAHHDPVKVSDWPSSEKSWYTKNTWAEPAEIFIVLPPGQNYTASSADPALASNN